MKKIPIMENTNQRFSHFQLRKNFIGVANPPFIAPLTRITAMPNQK
jgi:hypothetical protein